MILGVSSLKVEEFTDFISSFASEEEILKVLPSFLNGK